MRAVTDAETPSPDWQSQRDALSRIGWRAEHERAVPAETGRDRRIGRVIAQHRSGYKAHDGEREFPIQAPAAMIRAGVDPRERAVVGDWVVLEPGQVPTIESVLPRRTLLERAAAGERYQHQPIAANVDYVLVVVGLDHDYNPRRIERYLVIVRGSGAMPVIVLTKRDLAVDVDGKRAEIEKLAGPPAFVHVVDARDPETAVELAPYLKSGDTAVLVGSSGAGKSTLTNTLLGIVKMRTGEVREHDSRGRHTTTHRALIELPSGGCIIDTPGMREIKFTGDESLAETPSFDEIEALAAECRFGDCRHGSEPGCRVRAALAAGEIEAERHAHYLKLRDELDAAKHVAETQRKKKANARVMDKALGKRLTEKYGRRG